MKQPCHRNGYLQSSSDARKHRDRFKFNPLAKAGSLFVPQPLRLLGGLGHGCCCPDCPYCTSTPEEFEVTLSGFTDDSCDCDVFNDTFICSRYLRYTVCWWRYYELTSINCIPGCTWSGGFGVSVFPAPHALYVRLERIDSEGGFGGVLFDFNLWIEPGDCTNYDYDVPLLNHVQCPSYSLDYFCNPYGSTEPFCHVKGL